MRGKKSKQKENTDDQSGNQWSRKQKIEEISNTKSWFFQINKINQLAIPWLESVGTQLHSHPLGYVLPLFDLMWPWIAFLVFPTGHSALIYHGWWLWGVKMSLLWTEGPEWTMTNISGPSGFLVHSWWGRERIVQGRNWICCDQLVSWPA